MTDTVRQLTLTIQRTADLATRKQRIAWYLALVTAKSQYFGTGTAAAIARSHPQPSLILPSRRHRYRYRHRRNPPLFMSPILPFICCRCVYRRSIIFHVLRLYSNPKTKNQTDPFIHP